MSRREMLCSYNVVRSHVRLGTIGWNVCTAFKGYWKTLASGVNFLSYTIQKCPRVIRRDIASVWNFHVPSKSLNSEEFRELMADVVGSIDESATGSARPIRSNSCDTMTQ
ncbi:hypothetical protein EDC04DRAFT_2665872 [Pisolithus marmoratus]|nr:hypothetical protein EDC04DRAFT_2665872 [Pisolithus marmoratus]